MNLIKPCSVAFLTGNLLAGTVFGQADFKIIQSVIATGGIGVSVGGKYTLSGTAGQHSTQTLRGGAFSLGAGFWGGSDHLERLALPELKLSLTENRLIISWPLSDNPLVLQETGSLALPIAWVAVSEQPVIVAGENQLSIPLVGALKFYRLVSQGQ
jgi:hypothetical protein